MGADGQRPDPMDAAEPMEASRQRPTRAERLRLVAQPTRDRGWLLSGVRELGLCRLIINQTLCDPLVREDGLMVSRRRKTVLYTA